MSGLVEKGTYISRIPLLKSTNYVYWKTRMEIFIKTLDAIACKAILKGWKPPTKVGTSSGEGELKEIDYWTDIKCRLNNVNAKVLNTIFVVVEPKEFKLISMCRSAREA
jgi:hypothetical protein